MTDAELDDIVVASMLHIRTRVETTGKGWRYSKSSIELLRKTPKDAMTIRALMWEITKRCPEFEIGWDEEERHPDLRSLQALRATNAVARSLRRLEKIHRVERFPSGRRRDTPKFRVRNVLEALARCAE